MGNRLRSENNIKNKRKADVNLDNLNSQKIVSSSIKENSDKKRANSHQPHLSNKGYAYTLEVVIALAFLVIALTFVFGTAQSPAPTETALIKRQGLEALQYLDQNDELRILVYAGNENQIKKRLRDLLPGGIALEADVCTSVCEGNLPQGKTIVAVDYYISGYRDIYFAKKVRLWMWGSF